MDNTQEDTKDKDTKDITFYTVDCASELECHDYWDGMITDIELVGYAERVLFPYEPSVVFFQTGSNDYVQLSGTDEEKIITDNKLEGVRK